MTEVLLGTVAIEPNRWGTVTPDRHPVTAVGDWVGAVAEAGFDGLELWDGHLTTVSSDEVERVVDGPLPISIFNSYADFGPGPAAAATRADAAAWARRAGSRAVKFNVGNDAAEEAAYVDRVAAWLDDLPAGTAALCECHQGISIAEEPAVAARILERAGPVSHVQALVHTHDAPDLLRAKFDAYGDRITHVHVNFLDFVAMAHPTLADVVDELGSFVDLIRSLGFTGSWTLEFVAGLLTERDTPAVLVEQAASDLPILRAALGD